MHTLRDLWERRCSLVARGNAATDEATARAIGDEIRSVDADIVTAINNIEVQNTMVAAIAAHGLEHRDVTLDAETRAAADFFEKARIGDAIEVPAWGRGIAERAFLGVDQTTARGGDTVPSLVREYLESGVSLGGLIAAGLTVIPTDSGESLYVPARASRPTFSKIVEGGTFPTSDGTVGGWTYGAVKYGFISEVSYEFVNDTAINAVRFVANGISQAADLFLEDLVVNADGTTGNPTGILASGATAFTTAGTAAITADEILDVTYSLPKPRSTERGGVR